MSLSILQKFVYILYLYEASVFKYHEMEKCLEQKNLIYNVWSTAAIVLYFWL